MMNPGGNPAKAAEIAEFREVLLKEKEALLHEFRFLEEGNLKVSQGELSGENSYGDHFGDYGTDTFEREKDVSMETNVQDLLAQVHDALKRIDEGDYGICASCGKLIEPGRLRAIPYAVLCISCKEKEERSI